MLFEVACVELQQGDLQRGAQGSLLALPRCESLPTVYGVGGDRRFASRTPRCRVKSGGEVDVKAPRAVLFDLNGTLVDERGLPAAVAGTCADLVAAGVLPGVSADALLAENRKAFAARWPAAEKPWTFGRVDGATLSLEIWREALDACGSTDASVARLAVETLKLRRREALRLYEDVEDCLETLHGEWRLGLVTNGAADDQRELIEWLDLSRHFDTIVVSAEFGLAKPDPAIFEAALEQLGTRPEDAWHVGDSLRTDVAGAHAAGLTAVWLNRGREVRAADALLPDLEITSLRDLVEAILGER